MADDQSPEPPWTILKILRWTTNYFDDRGIDSARLDAELLLAEVLNLERIELYTQFNRPLVEDELAAFRALIKRRANREPTAYIIGHRHFWEFELKVDSRVLIPRPDTETLIRATLERLDEDSAERLVDIGTGSGAIALTLASERSQLQIAATDDSGDALDVATANAQALSLEERISFFKGDLLDALPDEWLPLDFIISNPPYIAESEREDLQPEVRDFEPADALFAGADGLDVIRRLVADARGALRPGGQLLFEIGYQQGEAVADLLATYDYDEIELLKDYGDRDRVAAARKPDD